MKSALLDPDAADRLRKLCGMLGSEHDGERAAAGLKADQLVRQLGLTWADVIAPPIAGDTPPICAWRAGESDWQRMARFCHVRQGQLSLRDRDFIRTMLEWRGVPSPKQQPWLIDLFMQCGGSR
jgi:hypothetical protein